MARVCVCFDFSWVQHVAPTYHWRNCVLQPGQAVPASAQLIFFDFYGSLTSAFKLKTLKFPIFNSECPGSKVRGIPMWEGGGRCLALPCHWHNCVQQHWQAVLSWSFVDFYSLLPSAFKLEAQKSSIFNSECKRSKVCGIPMWEGGGPSLAMPLTNCALVQARAQPIFPWCQLFSPVSFQSRSSKVPYF